MLEEGFRFDAEQLRSLSAPADARSSCPERHLPCECGTVTVAVTVLRLSPRGDGLVVATRDRIELRDATTGTVTRTLPKWAKRLRRAALSPDGRFVFATAVGGSVVKWDLGAGK